MRVILIAGLLGLSACADLQGAQQIALSPLKGVIPEWQREAPYPRPITQQYTQVQRSQSPQSAPTPDPAKIAAAQAAYAAWAQEPHRAHIRSLGVLDVAVVCATEDDVALVMHLIYQYKGDAMTDGITHGQFRIYHGAPVPPDPDAFGCSTVPAGTVVLVKYFQGLPVISVRTKDGLVRGVTHPDSVILDETPPQ